MRYLVTDVFTDRPFGGNPLAVFPEAGDLTGEQMQAIARELNLSETAFVLPARAAGRFCRVRIFTPETELPFAGHPTIGTALTLLHLGRVPDGADEIILEEGVGDVRVLIRREERAATLVVKNPVEVRPSELSTDTLASLLSLPPSAVAGPAWGASIGVPFLFLPLADLTALAGVRLRSDVWSSFLKDEWAAHVFTFVETGVDGPCVQLRARMFAPKLGIVEDPATGAAGAALAASYAARNVGTNHVVLRICQGIEMGRPSLITAMGYRRNGTVDEAHVTGCAVVVAEGAFTRLPEPPTA